MRSLNKAAAAALRVDLLEPLDLVTHMDHAKRGQEEAEDGHHKREDGRKRVLKCVVRLRGDGRHAEVGENGRVKVVDEGLVGTEALADNDGAVVALEVTTAREHVLDLNTGLGWKGRVDVEELGALAEGEEPYARANNKDYNEVGDEHPVEPNKAGRDMVALDGCEDRKDGGCGQEYTSDEPARQVCLGEDHVEEQVRLAEDDGESNGNCSTPEHHEGEEGVEPVDVLELHFGCMQGMRGLARDRDERRQVDGNERLFLRGSSARFMEVPRAEESILARNDSWSWKEKKGRRSTPGVACTKRKS